MVGEGSSQYSIHDAKTNLSRIIERCRARRSDHHQSQIRGFGPVGLTVREVSVSGGCGYLPPLTQKVLIASQHDRIP
jgi:hypothetical protein